METTLLIIAFLEYILIAYLSTKTERIKIFNNYYIDQIAFYGLSSTLLVFLLLSKIKGFLITPQDILLAMVTIMSGSILIGLVYLLTQKNHEVSTNNKFKIWILTLPIAVLLVYLISLF
jgi:hypothetical protein